MEFEVHDCGGVVIGDTVIGFISIWSRGFDRFKVEYTIDRDGIIKLNVDSPIYTKGLKSLTKQEKEFVCDHEEVLLSMFKRNGGNGHANFIQCEDCGQWYNKENFDTCVKCGHRNN